MHDGDCDRNRSGMAEPVTRGIISVKGKSLPVQDSAVGAALDIFQTDAKHQS